MFESILGGAAGCAITFGGRGFFGTLLIPPEPGTLYKFGNGLGGAIVGFLAGSLGGSI